MIRPAAIEELDRIVELCAAMVSESRSEILPTERTLEFFRQVAADAIGGRGAAVVAEERGEIVGLSIARREDLPFDTLFGDVALGWGTYVSPERRGQGLARELRQALKAALRGDGVETLLGTVASGNETALRSAESDGFTVYGINGFARLGGAS